MAAAGGGKGREGDGTATRPPFSCRERGQHLLPRLGLSGIVDDPLELHFQLTGSQVPATIVEPKLEEAATVVDHQVLPVLQVLDEVCQSRSWSSQRLTLTELCHTLFLNHS